MFKNLGGLFGGKSSPNESQKRPTISQPQFQPITIGDLTKFTAATVAPAQPAVVSTISNSGSQGVSLSDGPRRSVPEDTYVPNTPDGPKSYAASIVTNGISPLTPGNGTKSSRFDNIWRSRSKRWRGEEDVSPISNLGPVNENLASDRFRLNEDDYEDDPFSDAKSRYAASSIYGDRDSTNDPFSDGNQRTKSFKSRAGANLPPRLDTNFLTPHAYSPSLRSEASRYSNPFGNTPVQETSQRNFAYAQSPISSTESVNQGIRYSDCGVNPFNNLDDAARRERESSSTVGNIWDMIVGKGKEPKKTMPSPRIHIDTSALDRQSVARLSRTRSLMNARPPDSAGAVSPAEWFSNLLVDYEGRPPEISRAMSYIPTPITPHPPGLSPHEITSMAVPYLANLEAELAELRKYKADKEAHERAQEERDRVRDLIHRQLANEQAIEALQQAIGGKRMTRQQLESPNMWTEIDLSSTKRQQPNDRRSMETVWPGESQENAPPVPQIPETFQATSSNSSRATVWPSFEGNVPSVPKLQYQVNPSKFKASKPSKGFFGWGAKREKNEIVHPYKQETQEHQIVLNTSQKAAKVLSVASTALSDKTEQTSTSREQPSIASRVEDTGSPDEEVFVDEKAPRGRSHTRTNTTESFPVGSPPPYSRKAGSGPYHSHSDSRHTTTSENTITPGEGRRYPVRPADLPKLSTGATNHNENPAPRQLVRAVGLSQMQFTPTTPHHARSSQIYGQQRRAAPNTPMDLRDIGFRSNRPGDIRDRAEKKRRRQEKRERCFKRGGWLWMCGLCCGVSKMSRKLKIFWWTFLITLIVGSVILGAVLGVHKSNEKAVPVPENPLNMVTLPNLPPMPVGEVTVTPRLVRSVNTCVSPSTIWSCKLPPPLADGVNQDQPIFNWKIIGLNDTNQFVNPSPPLPLVEQYRNDSKIDDVKGSSLEGEPTNFYISLLASNTTTSTTLALPGKSKRSHARHFLRSADPSPQTTTERLQIPPAAVLPTTYTSQQLRFFDRGLPTEHYKFMTYFDKTIYLRDVNSNRDSSGTNKLDLNGGVSPAEAFYVCKIAQARFITKIYTRPDERTTDGKVKFIVDPQTMAANRDENAGGLAGYAVQIEEDVSTLVGGKNAASCWKIDARGNIDPTTRQQRVITAGIGTGNLASSDYRGCQCAWSNFKETSGDGF